MFRVNFYLAFAYEFYVFEHRVKTEGIVIFASKIQFCCCPKVTYEVTLNIKTANYPCGNAWFLFLMASSVMNICVCWHSAVSLEVWLISL